MNSESEFKKAFHDSVRKQGGFSFPIAMSTMSGIPDLFCAYPGYIPVLLEAKWLKDIPENGVFKRKIPYRALQQNYLTNANLAVSGSGWGLIGLDCGDKKFCAIIEPEIEIVTQDILRAFRSIEIKDNTIRIGELFHNHVPRLMCDNCT